MTPIHLRFRLNVQQIKAAFQLSARNFQQGMGWRRFLPNLQILGISIIFVSALLGLEGWLLLLWMVGALLTLLGGVFHQDYFYKKYANNTGECRVTIDDDGVLVRSEICEARYIWSVVQAISVQAGGVAIFLCDIQAVLYVPDSAFPDIETRQAFLAAMREHGIAGVPDAASAENALPATSSGFFSRYLRRRSRQ